MGVLELYELETDEGTYEQWCDTDLNAREWVKWLCAEGEYLEGAVLRRINTSPKSPRYGTVEKKWQVKVTKKGEKHIATCKRIA